MSLLALHAEMLRGVIRSDGDVEPLRSQNPGNWEPLEWDDLLEGVLGPWTAALVDDRVVSIAHTPRVMSSRAAECGVWTDARYRGRGHAAATTAAWIELLRPTRRALFYATTEDNLASQRVAGRLGLRALASATTLERRSTSSMHPLTRSR